MKALSGLQKFSSAGGLFTILREIDLGAVKQEAERRFSLLLLGDAALTRPVAETLCTARGEERAGYVHPWLTQAPLDTNELDADLAILLVAAPVSAEGSIALAKPQHTTPTLSDAATQALTRLAQRGVPAVVIFLHAAEAAQEVPHKREAARASLGAPSAPTWSDEVETVLVPTVLSALPTQHHLAFARHLPRFRGAVSQALVEETSRANAIYAVSTGVAEIVPVLNIPLNVADMMVLTKNQLVMAYKIALTSGKKGQPQEVLGEIIGVLGGSFFFRQVARQLVGLIPVWGIVPKVAVAYAGTWAIGQSVQLWAFKGKTPDQDDLRGFYEGALTRGRTFAKRLMDRGDAPELEADNEEQKKRRFRLPEFRRISPKVKRELPPSEEDS